MAKTNTCIICEQGWILIGIISVESKLNEKIILHNASVVRSWNNGRGIGGIVKEKNRDEYKLDYIGEVTIFTSKILFEIPCEW